MQDAAIELQSTIQEPRAEIAAIRAPWRRHTFSWLILAGIAALLWRTSQFHPWLHQRLESTPPLFIWVWIGLIGAAVVSTPVADGLWNRYRTACNRLFDAMERRPFRTGATLVLSSACAFGYFRIQRVDSGDILEWVMAGMQGKAFLVEHAPLETLIRCWLSEWLRFWPSLNPIVLYKTLGCLYGALYVWAVLWFSSRLERPTGYLIPLFFFAHSAMNVYFGYLEVYGAANLAQTVFLLTAYRFLQGYGSISRVSFWFGLALAMGFWHGILLPAYLNLVWRARRTVSWIDAPLQSLLVAVPSLLSLCGLIPYANPFAGIITRLSEPSTLIPLSPFAKASGYTLWGISHLADWAAVTMLLVPAALPLLIARLLCDFGSVKRMMESSAFRFALIACAACYSFGFVYHPVLGFPLDWDLYSFMVPPFGLCGAILMNDIERSRLWRKRLVAAILAAAALASCWILQNNLFWRYPIWLTRVGPLVSPFVPDFYYKNMQFAFERSNQANLYWMADRALEESPELYREILTFMDDWTVATLATLPPQPFDYPGWACDLALLPGGNRALIFDRLGRIFLHEGQNLKWVFVPDTQIEKLVVAGEVEADGNALILCENGRIFRVGKDVLELGSKEKAVWAKPEPAYDYLPPPPSQRNLPVKMVDIAIRGDGAVCVLDNFNRVWEVESKTLLLQGKPSYNLAQALHFNYSQQPVTVDVNDQLSYDSEQMKLPFPVAWFHPIVRDFLFTPDEKGLMILDLNGNIHYMGSTPIYKDIVQPGAIIDRYKKMTYLPDRDALLLLDNRYRRMEAGLDVDGSTAQRKIGNMIETGNYATAFNILSVLWRRSSVFTPICYELMDTQVIRNLPGAMMYIPEDAIPLYVDLLPVEENMAVLIDRWGRLVAFNKGVLFLLEGTGLASWPRSEAVDGAFANGRVFFVCQDGTVWQYEFRRFFGEQSTSFERTPSLWKDLREFGEDARWIGIETAGNGDELAALSAGGLLVRLAVNDGRLIEKTQIGAEGSAIFDFDFRDTGDGYAVAYTPPEGPAYIYTSRDGQRREAANSRFGWPVIGDIRFTRDENILLLDRYGVTHQYDSIHRFSDKPYTAIMDAMAFRYLPSGERALWMRSNGEIRTLRVREF